MKKIFFFAAAFSLFANLCISAAPAANSKKTLDLTKLGTTILYAQVYNMLMEAENFNGTRIKMRGTYYENKDINEGPLFQCIIVNDIAGCCSAGFDLLKSDKSIKFPKHLTEIEVEGTFLVREEDGIMRSYLVVDRVDVV